MVINFLMMKFYFFYALLFLNSIFLQAQSRQQLNLSGEGWRVWLDSAAQWKNDSLFLPRTLNMSAIKPHSPSCGWDSLYKMKGIMAKIPASFEELFGEGDPAWRYHGVGWFTKEIVIPEDWKNKTMILNIEKARLRIEIYINEKLAGYDIVAETPYSLDITPYAEPGKTNRIAIRITNPGGQRGWNDSPVVTWGKVSLCPGHDFGGLGNILLVGTSPAYIGDVFVKNLLPAKSNNIELNVLLVNKGATGNFNIEAEIFPYPSGESIAVKSWSTLVQAGDSLTSKQVFSVPEAKLWSVESPDLYYCKVRVKSGNTSDEHQVRFGFRIFEVKANSAGKHNFYLNGERIRIRSAIDWGYYWQTGFYATGEMARKSVENAKAIGNNCISFHRRIGEPLVMKYADELGLLIYEEPGGMQGISELRTPSWIMNTPDHPAYHAAFTMPEKFERMVIRDRNHPSVVIWSIVNEQCTYDYIHKRIFEETWKADNSRLLVNQSGGHYGDASGPIPHIRPYENNPRLDYQDDHTVDAKSRFQESDLFSHESKNDSSVIFWGEVRCYTGPDNFYLLSRPENKQGYDFRSWELLGEKTAAYFRQNNFSKHPTIKEPADLSREAGRGLMYINGRLSQAILSNNTNDGYAINGWSGADQSLGDDMLAWYSAICDEGRNLKGPASDYNYWTRSLQITARRLNGKYFKVGDTARFCIGIINENILPKGKYTLKIFATDGQNLVTDYSKELQVEIIGGDEHARIFIPDLPVVIKPGWNSGYLTLNCTLLSKGKVAADGMEQVLVSNRASWRPSLVKRTFTVMNWDAAHTALKEAGVSANYRISANKTGCILAGGVVHPDTFRLALKQVKAGASLIVKFDSAWAKLFYETGILNKPVTRWGGVQKPYWNGNGWGYVDLLSKNAVPSGYTIGTNSWEVNSDPVGFEPFESKYPQKSHGAFFFRPDLLLTLIGEIRYGKGKIILAPTFSVDQDNAFSDMLFFNLISYCKSNI